MIYHLKDKPVQAVQWTGNIKVFRNALEMMLKTDAIALQVINDKVYMAAEGFTGIIPMNDYFVKWTDEDWAYAPKQWFEDRYEE